MNNENNELLNNDVEINVSEENIILAPSVELFDEAKEIAQSTLYDEKFPFSLQYDISIYVPLRGGRPGMTTVITSPRKFQSTSPYAGNDMHIAVPMYRRKNFNPRPPTRGTTVAIGMTAETYAFQSTSPYAGDDSKYPRIADRSAISIHVPLRGGRPHVSKPRATPEIFQSTSPISYAVDLFAGKPVKAVYGYLIVFNRCRLRDSFL